MSTVPPHAPALTLAQAAERLGGKTPQRVSQLLAEGHLEGPSYAGRAPKNAARVWASSLETYIARRQPAPVESPPGLEERVAALEAALVDGSGALVARELALLRSREQAARSAALELKIAADRAREALEIEQQRVRQLAAENEGLRRRVRQAEERAALDRISTQAYADSLTPYLTPNDVDDL